MANYITTLEDNNGNGMLPITSLKALMDENGNYLDNQLTASDVNALKNGAVVSIGSTYSMNNWQDGSIDTTNGADYTYSGAIRYPYKIGIGTGVKKLDCDDGYYFLIFAWDLNDNYIGAYKSDGTFSKVASGWKSLHEWDCTQYPEYVFKPVMLKTGIATSDYTHFHFTGINGSQTISSAYTNGLFSDIRLGMYVTPAVTPSVGSYKAILKCCVSAIVARLGNIPVGVYMVQTQTTGARATAIINSYGGTATSCYMYGFIQVYASTLWTFYGNVSNDYDDIVARTITQS